MLVITCVICDIITLLSLFALYMVMDINRDVRTRYKIVKTLWNRRLNVFSYSNMTNKIKINKYKLNRQFNKYMLYRVTELMVLKVSLILVSEVIIDNNALRIMILILASNIIINIIEMVRVTIKIVYSTVIKEDNTDEIHKSKCNG